MDRIELRRTILEAMLPDVPFDGWSMATARAAAARAGLDPLDADRAFTDGVRDIIEFWSALADEAMIETLKGADLAQMRTRDRIAFAVRTRLELATPHKEALRRALTVLAMPGKGGKPVQMLYRTVDAIWYAIGDRSADFSFYTKRALLAAVYSSTLLCWIEDRSEGAVDSWAFLDRRIENVMKIPGLTKRVKEMGERLPNPLKLIPGAAKRTRFRSGLVG
jgi:ubiquinone biosynthesis protein COQ9